MAFGNQRARAAECRTTSGPDNRHRADQWLFVVTGGGEAIVNGKRRALMRGMLLQGDGHEIRNSGMLLRTLNFYAPPAYGKDGRPLPRAKVSAA